jgi:hypothetical protein
LISTDLDQAVGAGQQGHEGVVELVGGAGAHGFLGDVHLLADGAKQVEALQMHAQGGEAGVRAAVLNHRGIVESDTLSHGRRSFPDRHVYRCVPEGRSDCPLSVKSQRHTLPLVWAKFG